MNTTKRTSRNEQALHTLRVRVKHGAGESSPHEFTGSFRIGRGEDCDVRVDNPIVSRGHAEVLLIEGRWWLQDLNSANGTYINGQKIDRVNLDEYTVIELGKNGTVLELNIQKPVETKIDGDGLLSLTQYQEHYFGDSNEKDIGKRTMMVRQAFARVQKKQKRKYGSIIFIVTLLFVSAGGIAMYKHFQVQKQKQLAIDIFYNMKSLELQLSELLKIAKEQKDKEMIEKCNKFIEEQKKLSAKYDKYVENLKIYSENIPLEKRLILKIARMFGECEVNVPEDFTKEVMKYIKRWKATQRYKRAVAQAWEHGYSENIAKVMVAHGLPPQFFYLAMQESDFDAQACGPRTRWGIAKGMWQFIPDTAKRYGLKVGPLVEQPIFDPSDQRHHPGIATDAAARYLRDIYETEAQASGLLVMASYNWGENRVIELIRTLEASPRQRNFWNLLGNYREKIPTQTYEYVFSVFSAAVIGENPQLFGFDFPNPLVSATTGGAETGG